MKNNQLLAVLALAGTAACAADYTWNQTSGTNSFQTASYWTPSSGVPGPLDRALFTAAGAYGVRFDDHVTNMSASVGTGANVTFDLGGYTWQLTNTLPLTFTGAGTARIGGGTLELTQTNTAAYTTASPSLGTNQKLLLDGGTSVFNGIVNTTANGSIEVYGGSHSMLSGLDFNAAPAGGFSLHMTNGTVTVENISTIYDRRLTLLTSSKVKLEGGTLVSKKTTDLYGGAVIEVHTNATLHTMSGINFARAGGSKSTLNIMGGSVSNLGTISIGQTVNQPLSSTGIVHLADGLLHSGSLTFGSASNSTAFLRQSGGLLRVPGTMTLGAAQRTMGVYTQEGGTAWCGVINLGSGAGSAGEIVMTGGTLATPSQLSIGLGSGSAGRVVQSGGEFLVSNYLAVGTGAGAYGSYSNSGGRTWCNLMRVGAVSGATGEVFLTGGTLLSHGTGGGSVLGYVAGAGARMYQSGGELIVSNSLTLGNVSGAAGTYTNTGGSVWLSGGLFIGSSAGSLGRMFFSGSSLEPKGGIFVANLGTSTGELTLAGGLLPLTNTVLSVGVAAGAVGKVEISGGTNLFQTIGIGSSGQAFLRVTEGYTSTTNRLIVGMYAGSTGRVELAGGVLAMAEIDGRAGVEYVPAGGYSELLFDGGTLKHSVGGSGVFMYSFNKVTLTGRGATIETAEKALVLPQALSNETGHAGSFTKKGASKLTLSSPKNNFTGRVAVEQGELAVSGNVHLTGGVAVSPGALLSIPGTVSDALTASGTVSRIDGALVLKAGGALTNGLGASLSGSGVVTGRVVFASGSAWARDKADDAGPLRVTAGATFQSGVAVNLTGYTVQDLEAGIPLVSAASAGAIVTSGRLPVTLDGAPYNTWWATLSNGGTTLTAHVIPFGTLIRVK